MKTFEQQVAERVRTVTAVVVVLALGLLLTIGLAIYGFSTATAARSTAAVSAKRQASLAHRFAALASHRASTAEATSAFAVVRLQEEAAGECYRVNYLRWQVDAAAFTTWQKDQTVARVLGAFHAITALRDARNAFRAASRAAMFLPLTDCAAATGAPNTYRPPVAVPFNRVPLVVVRAVLAHPPQPVGQP